MADTDYTAHYSDAGFWGKVKGYAKTAGRGVLLPALKMYYSATDPDTPRWAKATIYGALGYFISPLDAKNQPVPLDIKIGLSNFRYTEVTGGGLKKGDKVITRAIIEKEGGL